MTSALGTLLLVLCCDVVWSGHVFFAPGHRYTYSYEGQTRLKDVGIFSAHAQALIVPLSPMNNNSRQHCKMKLDYYNLIVNNGHEDQQPNLEDLDYSKWMSFHISPVGEIERVFYERSENPLILALKKVLLSALSSRLVVSEQSLEGQKRWGYQAEEMGHEGSYTSVYKAEPDGTNIIFTKVKTSKIMSNAKEEHNKVVHFRPAQHVPHKVIIDEAFTSPTQDVEGYQPSVARTAEALHEGNNDLNLPAMSGNASVSMTLESIVSLDDYLQELSNMPANLLNSSLEVGEIPLPELSLRNASVQQALAGNISCIYKHDQQGLQHHTPCFGELANILSRLPYSDLTLFFHDNVMTGRQPQGVRQILVDGYGAAATNATWTVITELLLIGGQREMMDKDAGEKDSVNEVNKPSSVDSGAWLVRTEEEQQMWQNVSGELTLRSLVQFVGLDRIPPKILLDTLEEKALGQRFYFPDPEVTEQVNNRALLVLGAIAGYMLQYDPAWATGIMRQVETNTGTHDPYNHRQLREVLTMEQLADHVNLKATRILTMGNAGHLSSLPYLRSYLNDSNAHVLLKCAAVEALGNYPMKEIADELLVLAVTDQEENVKIVSLQKYQEHPYGGDITGMMEAEKQYGNVTAVDHVRIKRGIKDIVKRIWEGFEFKLESPSMDWKKAIGGSKLGASFGILIKNMLDLKISPLSGHLIVDVHDKAWATIHMGIVGYDLDIVKAELCFKGKIEYKLNILAEYGFEDVKKFAELYNKVVKVVFKKIKTIVQDFNGVLTSFKNFKPKDILEDLMKSIQDMPDKTLHLKQTARRVLEILTEYTDMPPVVDKVTAVIKKVTKLFKDIKDDVTRFYEAVVDAVTVTIPWAWNELTTAFKAIGAAIKTLLKDPKGTIQAIGESIKRISVAVTAVIEAKNKIVDANIFSKENRPYWFDLPEVLEDIWADVKAATKAAGDTIDWLGDLFRKDPDDKAKDYTGISANEMKRKALQEIISVVEEELAGPFEHIRRLVEPFLKAYTFFTQTVSNIKESWRLLVYGYKEARSQLDLIFGPKFHNEFPKKYLKSESCGDGFWESTGNGEYEHPGVDAQGEDMEIGSEVVTPFAGDLTVVSDRQVKIVVERLQNVELILDNVQAYDHFAELDGQPVAAGAGIGTLVKPPHCNDPHVHLALLKTTDNGYIDPSRYMERRRMPPPKWVQECDNYQLKWLGKTITSGSITKGASTEDKTPDLGDWLAKEEEFNITDDKPLFNRRKRDIKDTIVDKLTNFTQSLGLNITRFKELFSIKITDIKVQQVLDVLDKLGLGSLKKGIINILKKIEEIANHEECVRPDSMDDDQLKAALVMRGKNPVGSTDTLVKRYLETEPRCMGIQPKLSDNMYCRFDDACLAMSCCVDLKFFIYRHALVAYMAFDPCTLTLTLGLGDWTEAVDLTNLNSPIEHSGPVVREVSLLNIAQLVAYYRVTKDGDNIKVRIGVSWCSVEKEMCDDLLLLVKDATFPATTCKEGGGLVPIQTTMSDAPTVDNMLNMSITEVWKLADNMAGLDQETIKQLTDDLREAFKAWMMKKIEDVLMKIFGDEFNLFDLCAKGKELSFGPYKKPIVKRIKFLIPLGPIPAYFAFGVDGYYGAKFHCTLCVMSMKAEAHLKPQIGSSAWGELGVSLWAFRAYVKLTAYLLTTAFPTKAEIHFSKFPLDVRTRMDLELVPLRIELHAELIFEISFKIWGKRIRIRKVIFSKRLWFYQSKAINKNIFKVGEIERDKTPPDFSFYSKAVYKDKNDAKYRIVTPKPRGRRRKRATAVTTTNRCRVEQLPNRDHTEPGYNIELDVNDDRSTVTMTYCVGTYPGGCDVVSNESLGGTSTIVIRNLVSGHKLWYTVTAKNSQGSPRTATCELPTYDMTLPGGRVTESFSYSSHPSVLQASVFAIDDSQIVEEKASAGYGAGWHGWQVVDWVDIATTKVTTTVDINNDPLGLRLLEKFAPPKRGRLVYTAFKRASYSTPQACARDCLDYPPSRCQSFNYDYGDAGACELHEAVEGHGISIHESGAYSYFERIGIGRVSTLQYDGVNLKHGTSVYFNVYFKNVLGYEKILSSQAVEINLSPPQPGYIENAIEDVLNVEPCLDFTPEHLQQRCLVQTPLPNYRYIIDGPGSRTVFNGNTPLKDELYSRANRMLAANWDGFHDYVTGILIYTWSVGTDHCEDDVHPHNDPHAHLKDESEWIHSGVAFPLSLADGRYHVTVRPLSRIDFGGPMALAVCHSTPYTIDNTPPVIHEIHSVTYNETSYLITAIVNSTDNGGSGIARTEFGLGRSRRDVYLLNYVDVDDHEFVEHTQKIRDGVAAWVKIRVTDYVDLRASGHARKPIVVDTSPPVAGQVYDGPHKRKDWTFQSSAEELCASWEGFYDAQSGIIHYQVGLGSVSGEDNVVVLFNVSYETTSHCFTGLTLQHTATYYTVVRAWNGGHIEKEATAVSDGVTIDTTPPQSGLVKDGDVEDEDMQYSSDPATVAMHSGGFADPESGQKNAKWKIFRTHAGTESIETLLHSENVTGEVSKALHHLHLRHGDTVRSEVNVTNHARLSTHATSNGFTVDLTDPEMRFLHDGLDAAADRQFTADADRLSAVWGFFDDESGIHHYRLTAFQQQGSAQRQIFPADPQQAWLELPPSDTSWSSGDGVLTLTPGGRYIVQVGAVNGAGLTAVRKTNGVVVDITPPEMLYVHAGVQPGESEEVIEGVVLHNNPEGIVASWAGLDTESGIMMYEVAMGTSSGGADVMEWRDYGTAMSGFLGGLSLELTDRVSGMPLYFITVRATNGASQLSQLKTSSPIKVVPGDQTGTVTDGAGGVETDIDYQLQEHGLTVMFAGFESELDGISRHEVGVGTRPKYDDVHAFTSDGIISEDVGGIGSRGQAQLLMELEPGSQYYVSVRAITGAGNALDASADGVVVDSSPPSAAILSTGRPVAGTQSQSSIVYQRDPDAIPAEWMVEDGESPVSELVATVGTVPGGSDVLEVILEPGVLSLDTQLQPSAPGVANILSLTATNMVGLSNTSVAATVILDQSPPEAGEVHCPQYITGGSGVTCWWTDFLEAESRIDYFLFGLGHAPGDSGVMEFVTLPADTLQYVVQDLAVSHQDTLYATVIAVNMVGLSTQSTSAAIVVDDTAPLGGWVIELADIDSPDAVECADGAEYCPEQDAVCQRSMSQVIAAWEAFTDPETQIVRYDIGVGTLPGGTQLADFRPVPDPAQRHLVIRGLDLSSVRVVYVTVKGYNAAGHYTSRTSDGVAVSRVSAGLPSLAVSAVYDGLEDGDLEFLEWNEGLSAHWDFSGDPCPITAYRMAVHRVDGLVAVPPEDVPQGQTYGEVDELDLKDGETYFFIVTATNALGYTYSLYSNGVTVKLEPLLPGNVRDGNIFGVDLNFQPSVSSLSANWDGFGYDKNELPGGGGNNDDPDIDAEIGRHQIVERYEVAVGTDRRFPNTRNNVVPFVDVRRNNTWTFDYLALIPKTATYYVTVRAYSLNTAMVETTSNGIKVGYGGHIVKLGDINVPSWTPSEMSLIITWSGFEFLVPVKFYEVGITDSITELSEECADLKMETEDKELINSELATQLFSVFPLINVAKDTTINLDSLVLQDGRQYQVVVMATDESGICSLATAVTTVDVSPPEEGKLCVGPEFDMDVMYASESDQLSVSWTGYRDDQSGIAYQQISLSQGECDGVVDLDTVTLIEDMEIVPAGTTEFNYLGLELQENVPYFVTLHVVNHAGSSIETRSRPIVLDLHDPHAGEVHDGKSFAEDIQYQSDTTALSGSILYLPSDEGLACPYTMYPFTAPHADWTPLEHGSLQAMPDQVIRTLHFTGGQVSHSSEGLVLGVERSISAEKVKTACVATTTEMLNKGSYRFDMKTDGTAKTISVVTFWDGPQGLPASLNLPDLFEDAALEEQDGYGDVGGGIEALPDPVPGDTYVETFEDDFTGSKGFGFLLAPGMTHDTITSDWLVLWTVHEGAARLNYFDLGLNFTKVWHTYELQTLFEDDSTDILLDSSSLSLTVDGQLRNYLSGTPYFHGDVQVLLMAYTYRGYLPPLTDVFNPPASSVMVKDVRFPPPVTAVCRYGDPFRGGDRAVVEFLAGVGTTPDTADVVNFTQVVTPCIPCQEPCNIDQAMCTASCSPHVIQEFSFTLDGLSLDPLFHEDELVQNDNTTSLLPAPYFLIVKAVTGSGRSVISADNGIYIDPTPPDIKSIYHIDVEWDENEPSDYQGNDHSIAALVEVEDDESGITGCEWAIGSTSGGTEIQAYEAMEDEEFVINTELKGQLQNQQTYYISVRCTNEAGLTGSRTSNGVTVLLEEPDVSGANTTLPGTEPLGDEAQQTEKQDEVTVEWGEPGDPNVDAVYFSMGTDEESTDVFPERQVGYNSSGRMQVSGDGLTLDEEDPNAARANLSDARERTRRQARSQFFMEPGRELYVHIRVCSVAHKCAQIPVKPLLIARGEDKIANRDSNNQLELDLDGKITVKSKQGQASACQLVGGRLSHDDLTADYHSDASNNFKPSVVDPAATVNKTDRNLRNRIKSTTEDNFFLSSTCKLDGPVEITVPFDAGEMQEGELEPKLIVWCAASEQWVDVARSCGDTPLYSINWLTGTLTVQLCELTSLCGNEAASSRKKRATDGPSGQASFAVAVAAAAVVNRPPEVTSPSTVGMFEDDGYRKIPLTATDPDGDEFVFQLVNASSLMGNVTLTTDNFLIYYPCQNCEGTETIQFNVIEKRTDGEEALITSAFLTITINGVNDNPIVIVLSNGRNVIASNKAGFNIEENNEHNENYQDLHLILMAYDPDKNNDLTFQFENPANGNLTLHSQIRQVTFLDSNCATIDEMNWEKITRDIAEATGSFAIPRPCDVESDAFGADVSWVLTVVTYTPDENYYGEDLFKVISADQSGAPSELTSIELFVLSSPCHHGAACEGPDYDPDCSGKFRSNGFADYNCSCETGWSGSFCEEDYDDCLSLPCPNNMTCVDAFDNFTCICEPDKGCIVDEEEKLDAVKFLETWQYGLIAAGLAVPVIIVIVVLMYCCHAYQKQQDVMKRGANGYYPDYSDTGSRMALFRNRFVDHHPYEYQNPTFHHDYTPQAGMVAYKGRNMYRPGEDDFSDHPRRRESRRDRRRERRRESRRDRRSPEAEYYDDGILQALELAEESAVRDAATRAAAPVYVLYDDEDPRYAVREEAEEDVRRVFVYEDDFDDPRTAARRDYDRCRDRKDRSLDYDRHRDRRNRSNGSSSRDGLTEVEEVVMYDLPAHGHSRRPDDHRPWTPDYQDTDVILADIGSKTRSKQLPRVRTATRQPRIPRVAPAADYPGARAPPHYH